MDSPRTPTKSVTINKVVDSLNSKWGLEIPVRQELTSPSKAASRDTTEGIILKRIQFLCWKEPNGLKQALASFDANATKASSEWVFKAHADPDHLPHRIPSALDAPKVAELRDLLLQMLNAATNEASNRAEQSRDPSMLLGIMKKSVFEQF
jgi:hypothetical protein